MFNLFKKKNKIKELELRISVLEGIVAKLNVNETVCRKASITTLEVDKTDISHIERIKSGAINVEKNSSFSTPTPWEPYKEDKDLIIKIDGAVIGKIALEEIRKMQNKNDIKLNIV